METRELFWALDPVHILVFYGICIFAVLVFAVGIVCHVVKYRRGQAVGNELIWLDGVRRMLSDVISHRTIRKRDRKAGWAHAGIFYGFLLAFAGTSIITIDYDIVQPIFKVSFWKGGFYLWFSLILDLGHLVLTLSLLYMILRRSTFNLLKLNYIRAYAGETSHSHQSTYWVREDWFFLILLLAIEITGFIQEGVRILMEQPTWAAWSPVGNIVATVFGWSGMSAETAAAFRAGNWWFHGVIALVFTALIPWYKAKHMIATLGSLSVRDLKPLSRLPGEAADADHAGIKSVTDLTWKDMLHLDACTRCGRCHKVCPARTTGYPLSPRDVILDLRVHNDRCQGKSAADESIIDDVISSEALWACRSCGACQEVCPVGIEHPSLIVRMRRQLVDRGDMDPLLQSTLDTVANTGNSLGESARSRGAWTSALEFEVKDIRQQPAENLWFVGDYASFDPRNQKVSQCVARLLYEAGVDFGLLHEGERTAGNDIRRVGEEGLWELLAEHNLEQLNACEGFEQIITTDPHSYNTIKNEYPDLGGVAEINHYTSVLLRLLQKGQLTVSNPLKLTVTFHDPCHLGRLNGGYDAPRELLKLIGCEILEMPRSRENSFCCGAGGGRIFIPDPPGREKPSENRIREAAALGHAQIFVTCCPKDLTMFEDARKTAGVENEIEVRDIAELVAEAVGSGAIRKGDLPVIVEQLTDAVATRIADVVATRLEQVLSMQKPTTIEAAQTESLPASEASQDELQTASLPEAPPQASLTEIPPVELPEPEMQSTPVESAAQVPLTAVDWDNLRPVTAAEFEAYETPGREGPRILVMVKHAAALGDEYEFTSDGRDVKSEFVEYAMNEWDDVALEEALLAIEKTEGGEVVVVCLGPPEADTTLRKALAKGADRAVRVWHDNLRGADPVTVARALAGVTRHEQPDLVLCGVQTSDFSHGSTGMALAGILDLPHASVVVAIDWDGKGSVGLQRELEGGTLHSFSIPTPAVIAVQTGINQPRYATMRMIKQAKKKPLQVVDGAAVEDGSGGYRVRRMYIPEQTRAEMLGGDAREIAASITRIIQEHKGDKS